MSNEDARRFLISNINKMQSLTTTFLTIEDKMLREKVSSAVLSYIKTGNKALTHQMIGKIVMWFR